MSDIDLNEDVVIQIVLKLDFKDVVSLLSIKEFLQYNTVNLWRTYLTSGFISYE